MRVAHFISDEKFPDYAHKQFEYVIPNCSDFFIVGNDKPLKHIKKIEPFFVSSASYKNDDFLNKINAYDLVVIHSLTDYSKKLIKNLNSGTKILWIGFGFDYYELIRSELLMAKTNDFYKKTIPYYERYISYFKKTIKDCFMKGVGWDFLLKRINFFAPVLKEEYTKIKSIYPYMRCTYIDWNYGSSCEVVKSIGELNFSGNEILLGNSSSPNNNHIEALDFLSENLEKGRIVNMPLSYGSSDTFRNEIVNYAESSGLTVNPIVEYMEKHAYFEMTAKCSHVIMNHCRQQGLANIVVALFLGCRVFINEKNDAYTYFDELGCFVNTMADLIENPMLLNEHLDEVTKSKNKAIIKEITDEHFFFDRTKDFINQCF